VVFCAFYLFFPAPRLAGYEIGRTLWLLPFILARVSRSLRDRARPSPTQAVDLSTRSWSRSTEQGWDWVKQGGVLPHTGRDPPCAKTKAAKNRPREPQ